MAFCRFCGQKNADGAKFCIRCGKPLAVAEPTDPSSVDSIKEQNTVEKASAPKEDLPKEQKARIKEEASAPKEDLSNVPDVSESSLTNILANGLADIEKEMDEELKEEKIAPENIEGQKNAAQSQPPFGNPNFQGTQNQAQQPFENANSQPPFGSPNFQGMPQAQPPFGNSNFQGMPQSQQAFQNASGQQAFQNASGQQAFQNASGQQAFQNVSGQPPYGNQGNAQATIKGGKSHLPYIIIIIALVAVIAVGLILFFFKLKKTDSSSSENNTLSSEEVEKIISDKQKEASQDSEDSSSSEDTDDASDSEASNEDEETAKVPSDSDDSGVHRYELVVEDCTWSEAYQKALDKGGHLVRITSDEEYQAIANQIKSEGKENIKFYLGGKRDDDSDEYKWVYDVDGNMEYGDGVINKDPQYTSYWFHDEPSYVDKNTQIEENRMMMFYQKSDDKFVFNDSQDDILTSVPYYSGSIGYIVEYQ